MTQDDENEHPLYLALQAAYHAACYHPHGHSSGATKILDSLIRVHCPNEVRLAAMQAQAGMIPEGELAGRG